MKRSVDKALEQAAHIYTNAAKRFDPGIPSRVHEKSVARMRLQLEALQYAADFLEQLDPTSEEASILQLRKVITNLEPMLTEGTLE